MFGQFGELIKRTLNSTLIQGAVWSSRCHSGEALEDSRKVEGPSRTLCGHELHDTNGKQCFEKSIKFKDGGSGK